MEISTSSEKQAKLQAPKGRVLKEKRAKLYIIRRCIVMLLCWKENGDHCPYSPSLISKSRGHSTPQPFQA
ncbi:hypothetical protein VNO77_00413 [Canavalia gladiata]|uniref:Uncharacterized protein n=1 Tax=Canavalia gladiata TaxID=3824 RepID=A0AAN9MPC9_CANGL